MQKIEECDKKREKEHQISRKKLSEKYLFNKYDHHLIKQTDTPH
jgi:hypothetical protein